jgi:hypothetical protein
MKQASKQRTLEKALFENEQPMINDVKRVANFFDQVQGTDITQAEAWEFAKAIYGESTVRRGFNMYLEDSFVARVKLWSVIK